jgi:hypothetical protein
MIARPVGALTGTSGAACSDLAAVGATTETTFSMRLRRHPPPVVEGIDERFTLAEPPKLG